MVKRNKYLTVCDLDDTLLTRTKRILYQDIRFIRKYVKKGNYFVICTGRPYNGAIAFYQKLKINMPLIVANGAAIYYPDGRIKAFSIGLNIFKKLLKLLDSAIACAISTNQQVISIQNREMVPEWIIHKTEETTILEGKLIDIVDVEPLVLNLWIKEDCLDLFNDVMQQYQNVVDYRNWGLQNGFYGVELFSITASKGNAMLYLANELNIPIANTCAFGDQWNDLSMIEIAGYGVAMANGAEILKKATRFQTKYDNNHRGVTRFIKKNKLF